MAVLSDIDRAALWAEFMRDPQNINSTSSAVNKADLRAALNACDDWVDTNANAFNSALPLPYRTAATAKQKAALLAYVVMRRWNVAP